MIAPLRASGRLALSATFLALWTLGHLLAFPLGIANPRRRASWRARYLRGACRGLLRIIGVRVRAVGRPPESAGFLVSNHLGYVDVLVLASQLDASFVSRADVRDWPLLGPLTRMSGTIYIDRARTSRLPEVLERMERELAAGFTVVFFPEGTSGKGDVVMPFRPSLFEAPARSAAPVRCAALHYATPYGSEAAHRSVCWWGDMGFGGHVWGLLGLPRVDATVYWVGEEIRASDRKTIAARAHELVGSVFRPVVTAGEV